MVGILLSYWDGLFSAAMLVSFREGSLFFLFLSILRFSEVLLNPKMVIGTQISEASDVEIDDSWIGDLVCKTAG